nr:hypothetical protein CFP56_04200 [Quercus suber]
MLDLRLAQVVGNWRTGESFRKGTVITSRSSEFPTKRPWTFSYSVRPKTPLSSSTSGIIQHGAEKNPEDCRTLSADASTLYGHSFRRFVLGSATDGLRWRRLTHWQVAERKKRTQKSIEAKFQERLAAMRTDFEICTKDLDEGL